MRCNFAAGNPSKGFPVCCGGTRRSRNGFSTPCVIRSVFFFMASPCFFGSIAAAQKLAAMGALPPFPRKPFVKGLTENFLLANHIRINHR